MESTDRQTEGQKVKYLQTKRLRDRQRERQTDEKTQEQTEPFTNRYKKKQ